MKLIKLLYEYKIKIMFYFGLGFGEVANFINLAKNVAFFLAFLVLMFKFHFSLTASVIICVLSFIGFVILGLILKKTGMSDYASKIGNSVNPEIKMIPEIHAWVEEQKRKDINAPR